LKEQPISYELEIVEELAAKMETLKVLSKDLMI